MTHHSSQTRLFGGNALACGSKQEEDPRRKCGHHQQCETKRERSRSRMQVPECIRAGKASDAADGVDHPHCGCCGRLAQDFGRDRPEDWESRHDYIRHAEQYDCQQGRAG